MSEGRQQWFLKEDCAPFLTAALDVHRGEEAGAHVVPIGCLTARHPHPCLYSYLP